MYVCRIFKNFLWKQSIGGVRRPPSSEEKNCQYPPQECVRPKHSFLQRSFTKSFLQKLFTTKCVNIPNKSLRRQISTTRVRWPKTFQPSCFLQKSFTKSFHQKTDHINNDNARGQIVSSVVLIEGTKKAIFLFPPRTEDCLSKTDIGTQQSCTAAGSRRASDLRGAKCSGP